MCRFKKLLSLLAVLVFHAIIAWNLEACAAKKSKTKKKITVYNPTQAALVVDARTGKILHASNSKKRIYPASLTKVATLYMLFEALESGRLTLNQKIKVSEYATKAKPSKLHLKAGETIKVKDLILALSVKSANDAARVVAEALAGSEEKFARLMTVRARQLGMKNTVFKNASGWHHPDQKTTVVDLAKLAIAIKRDFPQYYHFFSKTSFVYNGKTINGHNKVMASYPGAEGLKTGFHLPSGYNLITTATRGNRSLVGVVIGGKTSLERDSKMVKLLDAHFDMKKERSRNPKAIKQVKRQVNKSQVASIAY